MRGAAVRGRAAEGSRGGQRTFGRRRKLPTLMMMVGQLEDEVVRENSRTTAP